VRLDFLGSRLFRLENSDLSRWISLDFLGFSRPNRAYSMGCAGFSLQENSRALFRAGSAGRGPGSWGQSESAALLKLRA
jgi:hypothetical protein